MAQRLKKLIADPKSLTDEDRKNLHELRASMQSTACAVQQTGHGEPFEEHDDDGSSGDDESSGDAHESVFEDDSVVHDCPARDPGL